MKPALNTDLLTHKLEYLYNKVVANSSTDYRILLSLVRTFFKENYDEILPAHYTWTVPEKGFKID
jgi:hypothetical protein